MTKLTKDDFTPGTVFTVASHFGSGRNARVQTFQVAAAPYRSENYEGRWMLTARCWIKSTQKFSGQAYVHSLENVLDATIVEAGEPDGIINEGDGPREDFSCGSAECEC